MSSANKLEKVGPPLYVSESSQLPTAPNTEPVIVLMILEPFQEKSHRRRLG